MKSKSIQLPLRTIKFNYEEEKPFSEYENNLLQRYMELHHILEGFESEIPPIRKQLDEINPIIQELTERLILVKKKLADLFLLSETLNSPGKELGPMACSKINAENEKYNLFVRSYHERLVESNALMDKVCADFNSLSDRSEDPFEDQLDKFYDLIGELFHNYALYQVDSETLGDDHEEFLECTSAFEDRMKILRDYLDKTIEKFDAMATECNLFYKYVQEKGELRKSDTVPVIKPTIMNN